MSMVYISYFMWILFSTSSVPNHPLLLYENMAVICVKTFCHEMEFKPLILIVFMVASYWILMYNVGFETILFPDFQSLYPFNHQVITRANGDSGHLHVFPGLTGSAHSIHRKCRRYPWRRKVSFHC